MGGPRRLRLCPELVANDAVDRRITEFYAAGLGQPPLDILVAALGPLVRRAGLSAPPSRPMESTAGRGRGRGESQSSGGVRIEWVGSAGQLWWSG